MNIEQKDYAVCYANGELKRLLDERTLSKEDTPKESDTVCGQPKEDFVKAIERVNELESEGKDINLNNNLKRNKAKQAYNILQSLDYEQEQRWYKKVRV